MKDWELLRDEIIENEQRVNTNDTGFMEFAKKLDLLPLKSQFSVDSEEKLADVIEINYFYIIRHGIITKDMVARYSDFFDRTGLEPDLDKVVSDKMADIERKEAYGDGIAPVSPEERRKDNARSCRRSLGASLKAAREKSGLSIREVEEHTGISKNIISRTEGGRANTTIDTIATLADCYGMEIRLVGR